MDDDDGLILNFASTSAAGGGTPATRQPNSRARRKEHIQNNRAQRQQQQQQQQHHHRQGAAAAAPSAAAPPPPPSRQRAASTQADGPAAKRQRVDGATNRTPAPTAAAGGGAPRATANSSAARVPAGGIISSLFPTHGVIADSAADDAKQQQSKKEHAPTNAPSANADFASLGLDPLLVAHLATKMDIGTRPTPIQKMALPHLLSNDASRDIFIQAQTGSGKTLTYLLPIVQSLLPLCEESFIDRSVGTLAVVLAPTRELARQIYEVLEKLVSLALTLKQQQEEADGDEDAQKHAVRRTRWLVPGLLCGGSTRNHEKQRLRKGCPILVSTPGRLLDHLQNTSSFEVAKCRWLILDEADRLLEMGFEEQLTGIIKALDGRRRLGCVAAREAMPGYDAEALPGTDAYIRDDEVTDSMGIAWWSHRRRVVLCSATLDENVQVLAGNTLQNPLVLRGGREEPTPATTAAAAAAAPEGDDANETAAVTKHHFSAPAQLEQNYVVTPPKLRLVTLLAVMRAYLSRAKKSLRFNDAAAAGAGAGRIIVFMSCTDSVDFHWRALGGTKMTAYEEEDADDDSSDSDDDDDGGVDGEAKQKKKKAGKKQAPIFQSSELIPDTPIYKLHGSMTQAERIASLRAFSRSGDAISAKNGAEAVAATNKGAILFCTSVASRGLDLPQVGCVVQLDPPTEGGIEEYLHRVGRTARVGKRGESWLLVQPQEEGWVHDVLEANMVIDTSTTTDDASLRRAGSGDRKISPASLEPVLQAGFGGAQGTLEYQSRATDVQLAFERWVLAREEGGELARRAFLSHVRAYATHPSEEKRWFNVRALHLGHLAKAFALREAPKSLGAKSKADLTSAATAVDKKRKSTSKSSGTTTAADAAAGSDDSDYEAAAGDGGVKDGFELDATALKRLMASKVKASGLADEVREAQRRMQGKGGKGETEAESRMYAKVRALGKMSRKHGVLAAHGADEFQIA